MKYSRLFVWSLVLVSIGFTSSAVFAVDHNNIDAGRPLSFDDAEAIAYRERSFEVGLAALSPRDHKAGLGLNAEFLYGFALNTHLSIDGNPSIGGKADSHETRLDGGDVSVGLLHNFNREYANVPAFAIRGDIELPTGRDRNGTNFRLRAIASKAVAQYDRVHLNLDGIIVSDPGKDERRFRPGAVLGYSKPIGYPRSFNTTGLADIAVQSSAKSGEGPVVSAGIGLRQQVTVRSVIDVGVRSDISASRGAPRDDVRLIAGYSIGF